MKKFIFCATLVALFTSCMKDDVVVDAVQRTEDFIATFADDTRADLDGTAVVWNADDHLTIFTKTSHNRQYRVKDLSANGRSATFEYVGYTGSDKTVISNNYAVYPYDAEATILGDVITTTLASEQTYNAECDLTYALMSAKSATNNFSFVNSGALLRFNISTILPDTFDLNYIKVSSQSHNIAGEVTIDTNDHLAVVTNNGTNEITLAEINETIDSDVKSFYIAMPAMSFEKSDLSVTFSFADGDKTFALPAFDLEQGKIKSIDYTIKDAEEFTGSTPGEDVPAAAKPANNEIWYTNGSTTTATEPYDASVFGANIVSNTYDAEKECWVIKFDGGVTTIGNYAFLYCSSLTSVTIPDSVTTIGNYAFLDCSSLTSITIPDSVTTIGKRAFEYCSSLTSVAIPDSVTTIGDGAFRDCSSLTSVTIPDSVTTIGDYAFTFCSSLREFNGKYASDNGRCLIIDGTLNSFAPAGLTEYTIPDSVTTIGERAFYYCSSLTSVTIPDSVTTIGYMAFGACSSLTSVTIPDSVTTIGDRAFEFCSRLTSVTIPDSVTTIGYAAFAYCYNLTSVTIGDNVTTIGYAAFYYCDSLTSVYCKAVTPPTAVLYDDGYWYTFDYNASGRKIYVPTESVEAYKSAQGWSEYASDIVGYDFENGVAVTPKPANNEIWYTNGSTTQATTPSETSAFGANIVSNTYDDEKECWVITFDGDVTTIGDYAFYQCEAITSVTLGQSVEYIGFKAFDDCIRITEITIPDSVHTIGVQAFCYCTSLSSFKGKFASEDGKCLIVDGRLIAFAIGCDDVGEYVIPDDVTEITNYSVFYCKSMSSLVIPDSVTTIGDYAFRECSSLTSVTIPDSVTTIGNYAFYQCSSLTSVTIPDSVTSIGWGAFYECSSLQEFNGKFASEDGRCLIIDGVLNYSAPAGLTEYTIPDSIITIGNCAFWDCRSLTSVTIPDSVTTIGNYAFRYCSSLTSVTIPDSVTSIGYYAFCDCYSLTSVYCKATTPPAVTLGYYGWCAFDYSASGLKIYVPIESVEAYKSAEGWSEYADAIEGYNF